MLAGEHTKIATQLIEAELLGDGGGYTWTLASQLGKMLRLAESRFGQRDKSYTILGVEFTDGGPQIWYPGNCRHIIVQLGRACLLEPDRACFQLAHETIHLLSPTGSQNANVLEEGLAAHFQVWYMANHYPSNWPRPTLDWNRFTRQSYARAKDMVEQLLKEDRDIIRRLRAHQPTLSRIKSEEIENACPEFPREVAIALTLRFNR